MQSFLTDLRYALRSFARAPFFAVVVMVLLTLGIGANTLIFTAVDALLLRPLPISHPEELVRLGVQVSPSHVSYEHPYIYTQVLARQVRSYSDVFASWPMEMAVDLGSEVESITGETVSPNYFSSLGLTPFKGRLLNAEDEQRDASVAVLSFAFWHRAFGTRDPIGKTFRLRGSPFTVVGVLEPGFAGLDLGKRTDVWVTMSAEKLWFSKPNTRLAECEVFLRRRAAVPLPQAEAEIRTLFPSLVEAEYEGQAGVTRKDIDHWKARTALITPAGLGVSTLRKNFASAAIALMGAGIGLLLLVCANVGGLIAARGEASRADIAIRLSLGASRWSLLQRTWVEALLLSLGGAVGGWVVATWSGPLLLRFLPQRRPLNIELVPDARILSFAVLACICTALIVSILPAWTAVRTNTNALMTRSGTRVSHKRVSHWLVALQVAISTVLLIGCLSLVRSLDRLRSQDPGFRRKNLIVMTVNPRMAGIKSEQIPQVFDEIVRRIQAVPAVDGVSLANSALMRGIGLKTTSGRTGTQVTFADSLNTSVNNVSLRHFSNLRIRLLEGRDFRSGDDIAKPKPAIINESFARQFFPGRSAIGRTFGTGPPGTVIDASQEVIGVVNDTKYRSMRESPPTFYNLLDQEDVKFSDGLAVHVSTQGDPGPMIQQLRKVLASISAGLAPTDVATMEQEIETSLWQERLLAALASAFAALAAVLAGLGLFGMLAYAVSQRKREIGIRMAIGATARRIASLVIRDASLSVLPGALIGVVFYALCSRTMGSLLFDVSQFDPLSIAGAIAGIAGMCALATFIPALRASSIPPSQALRDD